MTMLKSAYAYALLHIVTSLNVLHNYFVLV